MYKDLSDFGLDKNEKIKKFVCSDIKSHSRLSERISSFNDKFSEFIKKLLQDSGLVLVCKNGTAQTENLNEALKTENQTGIKIINVRSDGSDPSQTRLDTINKFKSYARSHNISINNSYNTRLNFLDVVTTEYRFVLRFREEVNKKSLSEKTNIYERSIVFVVNNHDLFDFSGTLENFEKTLADNGFDISYLDDYYKKTIFKVSQIIMTDFITGDIECDWNKDLSGICGKIREYLKDRRTGNVIKRYESWNKADIWIYRRSDREVLERELSELIERHSDINEFNNFFVSHLPVNGNKTDAPLVGISLKKLDVGDNYSISYVNVTEDDIHSNETDSFKEIDGLDDVYYLRIMSEWCPSGYVYRSSRRSIGQACSFNYRVKMSQIGWVGYQKFTQWEEINSKIMDFGRIVKNGLSDNEIVSMSRELSIAGSEFSERLKKYCESVCQNPESFKNTHKFDFRIKSQLMAMAFIFLNMTKEEKDSVCTKIMNYVKSNYHGQGPYAYIRES